MSVNFLKGWNIYFITIIMLKGNIISANDKNVFEVLVNQLISEKENEQVFNEIIIQNIVFLLLHLIARDVQQNVTNYFKKGKRTNKIHEVTPYIQQNIYNMHLIRIEN